MRSYTEKIDHYKSSESLNTFHKIKQILELFDESKIRYGSKENKTNELSSHMLVESIGKIFPDLIICHGMYKKCFSHGWLTTKRNDIIDIYPWAIVGGPLFIAGDFHWTTRDYSYNENLFKEFDNKEFNRITNEIYLELNNIYNNS